MKEVFMAFAGIEAEKYSMATYFHIYICLLTFLSLILGVWL